MNEDLPPSEALPEDAREREEWDRQTAALFSGDRLSHARLALAIWAKTLPPGSMAAMCAIIHNELINAEL